MVVKQKKNIALKGRHGRPVIADVFYNSDAGKKPVIIFCHGYKGFKDWGVWDFMAEEFVQKGFFFIKFNFAYNGGNLEQPIDFPDLEAFGANTYTRELDDLEVVLDWVSSRKFEFSEMADASHISLLGHSRGGGIVIIKAAEDKRVKKLVTLASVSDYASRFPSGETLKDWEMNGIAYVENARTKQQMPHLYEFYLDFKRNEERLSISRAAKQLDIPFLIIHGTEDPTVNIDNAHHLKEWNPSAELFLLEGSDHVFEASHPWEKNEMPHTFYKIVEKSATFINRKTT